MGFWVFENAGITTFKCERDDENIVVTIDAQTNGLIDMIVHRHNIYETVMKLEKDTHNSIFFNYECRTSNYEFRIVF